MNMYVGSHMHTSHVVKSSFAATAGSKKAEVKPALCIHGPQSQDVVCFLTSHRKKRCFRGDRDA